MRKEIERILSFHSFGKLLMTIVAMLCLIPCGKAQDYARRLRLPGESILITVSDNKVYLEKKTDLDKAKYYLLVNNTWMPTKGKSDGSVFFEKELIPINGMLCPNTDSLISDWQGDRRQLLADHTPLEGIKLVQRIVSFRYADTIFKKEGFETYKDSLVHRKKEVSTYIKVENGENADNIPFKLVVNDTLLVKDARFITGDSIPLDANLMKLLGLPTDTTLTEVVQMGINRIQVIPDGRVPSYIHKMIIDPTAKEVDYTAVPSGYKKEPEKPSLKKWLAEHRWSWIVIGVLVLALIAWLTKRMWISTLKKILKPKAKRFEFNLSNINKQGEHPAKCFNKLWEKKTDSMKCKRISDTEEIISFEVNEDNAEQFLIPQTDTIGEPKASLNPTFYQILKGYIEGIDPDELNDIKQDNLELAKKKLQKVEDFAASLLGEQPQKPYPTDESFGIQGTTGEPPQTPIVGTPKESIESLKQTIKKQERELAEKQRQIETLTSDKTRLNKKIKDLEDDIRLWQTDTGCTSSSNAKQKIEQLQASKKELDEVKRDPASFKNKPGYGKLTEIIENAEKGENIRKELNENPDKLDPKLKSGMLVEKGKIFEKCLIDPDYIFNTKYEDSVLAKQVYKGDFLDKAKDHVKEIVDCKEPWMVGSELQKFINYVVNPETILTSKQVNTGLYKLVDDLENLISKKAKAGQPINPSELSSNWLNHQINETLTGYNTLLLIIEVAKDFGIKKMDINRLTADLQPVFAAAEASLEFREYKNYWKNIINPVFVTLEGLPNHDEIHNTRALLFYTSQFYSIACIMNGIYGNDLYDTERAKLNIKVFNGNAAPVPTHYGFPEIDQSALDKCKFQYKGAPGEDEKVTFLKKYKPLPFILISSYFD